VSARHKGESQEDNERKRVLEGGFDARSEVFSRAPWLAYPQLLDEPLKLLNLKGGETAIELGIGSGSVSRRIISAGATVVGVDISEKMLEQASRFIPRHSLLKFDAERLTDLFLPSSFDIVLSRNLLTHVDIPRVLNGAARTLKPQGHLLLIEACALRGDDSSFFLEFAEHLHPGHASYPTGEEILRLVTSSRLTVLHQELVEHTVSLSGYRHSTADPSDEHWDKIYRLFKDSPEDIKTRYRFAEKPDDISFAGYWIVVLATRDN
jgi:2-polyprenyl-3-methyl-5-hydroxy-6-metoxy-1,4-benzoquinol methylase